MVRRTLILVAVSCVIGAHAGYALGADFRVESNVFDDSTGRSASPFSRNLTLFRAGTVYDFLLDDPNRVTIFDPAAGTFTLLDGRRKIKTYVDRENLLRFIVALQDRAREAGPLHQFAADPEFQAEFDPATGQVTLASPRWTYRARGSRVENRQAATQYMQFADWYARINATRVGAMPPMPRLELNQALADRGLTPTEVQLSLDRGEKKTELRSTHQFGWKLAPGDDDRVKSARSMAKLFREVPFQKFRQIKLPDSELDGPGR